MMTDQYWETELHLCCLVCINNDLHLIKSDLYGITRKTLLKGSHHGLKKNESPELAFGACTLLE